MTAQTPSIDVEGILAGLKDFQRATVDYVFRRIWIDDDRTHRFLVADEVGLGKTLVAKGVIAKSIQHLQSRGIERIDVVYICSNADIARQNLSRLSVFPKDQFTHVTRLTLLPTQLSQISRNPVNFVSFTPATSFDLGQSGGQASERVLLYRLVEGAWGFGGGTGPMNLFQGAVQNIQGFRDSILQLKPQSIDAKLKAAFLKRLTSHDNHCRTEGKAGLRARFESLIERLPRAGASLERALRRERDGLIADLRRTLARTCIDALEPDLVILDEFQRFKNLLQRSAEEEDPAQELAQVLFDHQQHEDLGKTRVLMLSATPYRMYTTASDSEADNHYEDFADTLRFLQDDPSNSLRAEQLLRQYKKALFLAPRDGAASLKEVKSSLEKELTRVMVRTERLAASADRNGMLREISSDSLPFSARDAKSFCATQQVARALEQPDVTEYWKAAPYLLSFAKDYAISDDLENKGTSRQLTRLIVSPDLQIPQDVRRGTAPVDPAHPRLRWLLGQLSESGMWRMLWLSPSLPYYASARGGSSEKSPTKRLVFSSWRMVPRSIATLVSVEAERQLHGPDRKFDLPDAVTAVSPPIAFALKDGAPRALNVLSILYPSFALAEIGDPLRLAAEFGNSLTIDTVLDIVETRVVKALSGINSSAEIDGRVDDRWYWWAPVLLDAASDGLAAKYWLDRSSLSELWAGLDPANVRNHQDEAHRGWSAHVTQLRQIMTGRLKPLGRPPDDLARVLAMLALGGPAVCALRALGRGRENWTEHPLRDAAASVAFAMRTLFNVPEVVSMLRGGSDDVEVYWKAVLRRCFDDNLQAVLDEWAHILPESLGVSTEPPGNRAARVAEAMREVLTLRSAQVVNERFTVTGRTLHRENERYRSRFALRFGDTERGADEQDVIRPAAVRSAFNSPFWPFVLASTTVGQEGLDFHQYCHAVVHWNLPHNPVDLEQREGRVHRYKGHAVRKNIAMAHGSTVIRSGSKDPWTDLFAHASATRQSGSSDITPYWAYSVDGGATIERHVPALPMSRDRLRLDSLRRSLVLYRMAFGQPRQDELVSYLAKVIPADQLEGLSTMLRIDLSPPTAAL